jgi:hypothetical protein
VEPYFEILSLVSSHFGSNTPNPPRAWVLPDAEEALTESRPKESGGRASNSPDGGKCLR